MNFRKHIVLISGLGVAAVLMVAAIVMLLKFQKQYSGIDAKLQSNLRQLTSLNQGNPYPSKSNVALANANLDKMKIILKNVTSALRKDQIEPRVLESAEFPPLLEKVQSQIIIAATNAKVDIPATFAFGFKRYIDGDLPQQSEIPRLVVQLAELESLCDILFASKITSIESISRTEFETKRSDTDVVNLARDDDRRGRRSRGRRTRDSGNAPSPAGRGTNSETEPSAENELYSFEHYKIAFTSRENAMWDVLNAMASSSMFIVVTKVESTGAAIATTVPQSTVSPLSRTTTQMGASLGSPLQRPKSHDERVVAGRSPVSIEMELNVFRFKPVDAEEVRQ